METSAIFTNSLVEVKLVAPASSAFLFQLLNCACHHIPAGHIRSDSIRPEMYLAKPARHNFQPRGRMGWHSINCYITDWHKPRSIPAPVTMHSTWNAPTTAQRTASPGPPCPFRLSRRKTPSNHAKTGKILPSTSHPSDFQPDRCRIGQPEKPHNTGFGVPAHTAAGPSPSFTHFSLRSFPHVTGCSRCNENDQR